jgi:DNA polymerase-3 subunit delta'
MLAELERHPGARAVLGPALAPEAQASHAYLFHGPGGAGKAAAARAFAAELLADGEADPDSARQRALAGQHPDLTWVVPSGAHEILVGDIDGPVVAAASRTPFESSRRVFVIECADQLGEEAGNRMLKTLEEPPAYVHLILITDRLGDVLPTIRSRCQAVRFDAPAPQEIAAELEAAGTPHETAVALARLSLGDASRARELASPEGGRLRDAAEAYTRAAIDSQAAGSAPWTALLASVRARGERIRQELEDQQRVALELLPRKEQKRAETEWTDRIRRSRRRAETGALDLALTLVATWLLDLAALDWGAEDLVRNSDRLERLEEDRRGVDGQRLRRAVELVEDTRLRLPLNVNEELACEALAYRLERVLNG